MKVNVRQKPASRDRLIANRTANTTVTMIPVAAREQRMIEKGSDHGRNSTVLFKHRCNFLDEYCLSLQGLHLEPAQRKTNNI